MIYALIMCAYVGLPYESCEVYPQDSPVIYKTLEECKYYERLMKMAFPPHNPARITVECRGKQLPQWEPVR
jgi:hypothetical protein